MKTKKLLSAILSAAMLCGTLSPLFTTTAISVPTSPFVLPPEIRQDIAKAINTDAFVYWMEAPILPDDGEQDVTILTPEHSYMLRLNATNSTIHAVLDSSVQYTSFSVYSDCKIDTELEALAGYIGKLIVCTAEQPQADAVETTVTTQETSALSTNMDSHSSAYEYTLTTAYSDNTDTEKARWAWDAIHALSGMEDVQFSLFCMSWMEGEKIGEYSYNSETTVASTERYAKADSTKNGYGVKNSSGSTSFSPLANYLDFDFPLKTVPAEYAGEFCSVSASVTHTGFIVSLPEAPGDTVEIAGETCKNRGWAWTSAHYAVRPCGNLVHGWQAQNSSTADEYGYLKATEFYPEQYEEYLGVPVTLLTEDSPYFLVEQLPGSFGRITDQQWETQYEKLYGALTDAEGIEVKMIAYEVRQTYDQYQNYIEIVYTEGSDAETMRPVLEEYGLDYSNPDEVDAPDCLYYSGDAQAAIALCETLNTLDGIEYARPWYMNIAIGGRDAQFLVGVAPVEWYPKTYGAQVGSYTLSFSPLQTGATLRLPAVDVEESYTGQFCSVGAEIGFTGIVISLPETPAETAELFGETFTRYDGSWRSEHFALYTCADYIHVNCDLFDYGFSYLQAKTLYPEQYTAYLHVPFTALDVESPYYIVKLHTAGVSIEALYKLLETDANTTIEGCAYHVRQTYNEYHNDIIIRYTSEEAEAALRPTLEAKGLDFETEPFDYDSSAVFSGDAAAAAKLCEELNALEGIAEIYPAYENIAPAGRDANLLAMVPVAPAGAYIGAKGDLDDDGEITARDAQTALMAAAAVMTELEPALNTPQMAIADIDGDGTVTPKDAQSLLVYAAKVMSEQEVSWDMILGTNTK